MHSHREEHVAWRVERCLPLAITDCPLHWLVDWLLGLPTLSQHGPVSTDHLLLCEAEQANFVQNASPVQVRGHAQLLVHPRRGRRAHGAGHHASTQSDSQLQQPTCSRNRQVYYSPFNRPEISLQCPSGLFLLIGGAVLVFFSPLFALYEFFYTNQMDRSAPNSNGRRPNRNIESNDASHQAANDQLPNYDEITRNEASRRSSSLSKNVCYPERMASHRMSETSSASTLPPAYNDISVDKPNTATRAGVGAASTSTTTVPEQASPSPVAVPPETACYTNPVALDYTESVLI